jgi:hypothetical protein
MIIVLPTNTGFLVGTLPLEQGKENRLRRLLPNGPKTHRKQVNKHWAKVRRWIRSVAPTAN